MQSKKHLVYSGLLIFFFFALQCSYGQNSPIDSLLHQLRKTQVDTNKIELYLVLSNEYRFIALDTALAYGNQAVELAQKVKTKNWLAQAYNNLGVVYDELGGIEQSLKFHQLAVEINEKTNNKRFLGANYTNIGVIYYEQKSYPEAEKYFEKALKLAEEIDNKKLVYNNLINFGNIYHEHRKNLDSAIIFYNRAYNLAQKMEDGYQRRLPFVLNNLALSHKEAKHYSLALKYAWQALKISQETDNKNLQAESLNNLGSLYTQIKNYKYAERMLSQAAILAKNLSYRKFLLDNYQYYVDLYVARKEFEKALISQKNHNLLEDSMLNNEKTELLANFQILYQTSQKEKENLKLQAEQKLLKKDSEINTQHLEFQRFITWVISIGFVLVLILLYVSYRQIRQKQKTNLALLQKNEIQERFNAEIQALNGSLEEKIKERTAKLKKQNEVLLDYSFLNSHRIRKHVATILGLVYLMNQKEISTEEQSAYIQHINFCAQEMDKIIHQINEDLEINLGE